MSEEGRPSAEEVARMLRQHLASLQAEGVEYLPVSREPLGPAVPATPAPTPQPQAVPAPSVPASLPVANLLFSPGSDNAPATPDARRHSLTVLAERVAGCTRCPALASTRTQTVFGVGPPDAELCFLGEAPGADEDAQGEPFVGAAGQLLNRIIVACGLRREDVYICNILRCRPPQNRQPQPDEAANCREWLDATLDLVRPRHICCLGATAAQNLLNTRQGIGKLRGRFLDYHGIPVLCTYHPSFLLRYPENKKFVWEDMKLLLARMGRTIPARRDPGA